MKILKDEVERRLNIDKNYIKNEQVSQRFHFIFIVFRSISISCFLSLVLEGIEVMMKSVQVMEAHRERKERSLGILRNIAALVH